MREKIIYTTEGEKEEFGIFEWTDEGAGLMNLIMGLKFDFLKSDRESIKNEIFGLLSRFAI
jgi:hypothetical protein